MAQPGQYGRFAIDGAADSRINTSLESINNGPAAPSLFRTQQSIINTVIKNPISAPNAGSFDPAAIRKNNLPGAALNPNPVKNDVDVYVQTGSTPNANDWRVKVGLGINSKIFYKSATPGIMQPLIATGGAIFPYTPQISVTHNARYAEAKLTHSNYASYFYEGSDVSAVSIQGEFTVQNVEEGRYLLAVISFFRSATKMFFGNQDAAGVTGGPQPGTPPPLLFLNGYGKYYFPSVPCVLTQFQHTMPADVDYIEVISNINEGQYANKTQIGQSFQTSSSLYGQGVTRVPTSSQIQITLQPVYSRKRIHEQFNLEKFANGDLLTTVGGFI